MSTKMKQGVFKKVMTHQFETIIPTASFEDLLSPALAHSLIIQQFPQYAALPVSDIEKQGHDNRTYRLGKELLIRMPTAHEYALKVPMEQELLPKLAPYLSISIPTPIKIGAPSKEYPYPFSIYKWLAGASLNLTTLNSTELKQLAIDLSKFLTQLQAIELKGPAPGQHNWWRGDHVSVYDQGARKQIIELNGLIDKTKAIDLWEKACATAWEKPPVWVNCDLVLGNMLIQNGRLSAIIDFGGAAVGDPACDLVIAWTYLSGESRKIFIKGLSLDENTWLRARAWALWKATFELCNIEDKNSEAARGQIKIIKDVMEYEKC